MLLKDLTNIHGASGDESRVREFIISKVKDICDSYETDNLGNLYVYKKRKRSKFTVMICAHMDEVGMIVSGFGDMGSLKFQYIGGIDDRIMPGKRVVVGKNQLPGVIGAKPIHLQSVAERKSKIDRKKLSIDIGASKKEEAEALVSLGDYVYFDSEYSEFGKGFIKAKALDDRVGCSIMIEILKEEYDFDICACFTVQEEIGLRGAGVAAHKVKPDFALVIEGTTCSDVPHCKEHEYSTRLGHGPVLSLMDRVMITQPSLVDYVETMAKENNMKYQYKETCSGGNDAGKIHITDGGIKTLAISVPIRYIHSPVSVMKKSDYLDTKKLIHTLLERLDKKIVMHKN